MVTQARLLPDDSRRPRRSRREMRRAELTKHRRANPVLALLREFTVVVVVALGLSLLLKTLVLQAFFIPSGSMEQTLVPGDRVVVSKLTPGPFDLHRGDVVVFADPGGWLPPAHRISRGPVRDHLHSALVFVGLVPTDADDHLIKRVVGLPGDRVVCCDARHRVSINGTAIDEPYLYPGDIPSTSDFSVTVPPGKLWVMGDHRSDSADSRAHSTLDHGMVPVSDVVGRTYALLWPIDRFAVLHTPNNFAEVPRP